MSSERFRGRPILSQGMENIVLRGKSDSVLKISRPFNSISMIMAGRNQADVLREELAEARALVSGTSVRIPRTIILSGKERNILGMHTKPYVMGQRYVEEDETVSNIQSHLAEQGLDTLVEEYRHEPRNFISNNGTVYWVDPTKGTVGRMLETTKLMKLETYRKIRRKFSKLIRAVGL